MYIQLKILFPILLLTCIHNTMLPMKKSKTKSDFKENVAEYLGRDIACCGMGAGLVFLIWGFKELMCAEDGGHSSILISLGAIETGGSLALRSCHAIIERKIKRE